MDIDQKLKVASKNAILRLGLAGISFSDTYCDSTTDDWYLHFRKNDATRFSVIINLDEVLAHTGSTDTDALTEEIAKELQGQTLAA